MFEIKGVVNLKKGEGRTLNAGGLWVYDNEIEYVTGNIADGDLCAVKSNNGYPLGIGYYNKKSKITVRMLTRNPGESISEEFFKKRIVSAWNYRKKVVDTSSCRLIFGEADFLPGITVDKFNDIIVVQSLSAGIDRFKDLIVKLIFEVLSKDGINLRGAYERSDAKVRELEGLERKTGFLTEEFDTTVMITENNVKYYVDVANGQKTGFFLDQKYNRLAVQKLCRDADVLDCFTHTGSFALNAGIAGAKSVLGLDASDTAILMATENAKLNNLSDTVKFECADVLDWLPKAHAEGKKYDVVILDPPAFTKSRDSVKKAMKGYREINMQGLKLVKNGGFLCTCSCSHFMTPDLFAEVIEQAAKSVHKNLRQVEFRTQAPDHPILWSAEESYYLKFYIFNVVDEE